MENADLLIKIRRIFDNSEGRYGSPKVYQTLKSQGVRVGENRVARLMREWGMKARTYRIYRRLLTRRAILRAWPNYRLATEKPVTPNQQWSSDVTYIKMGRKNVFLAVVLDLFSRRIVGWKLESSLNDELSSSALKQALAERSPPPGLLLHTDRGTEFRALKMREMLARKQIIHSMSRPGYCTDNAEVESFFKSLKGELLHATSFATLRQLRHHIKHYIERFYSTQRLHSSLGYRTQLEFESAN